MSEPSSPPVIASSQMEEHDALPAGTRFGELEIVRVVGVGGFGIVYLARDHSLDRDVALKEYMPSQLAARGPSAQVSLRSGSHMETFALGLRSFVNEARLLARFDHRSLVKVYRFWEANNTAYMVMPFLQGRTLREVRRAMPSPPNEVWLRQNLNPLFDALEVLHREAVYHRDIAPDNILLPNDGSQAVLLDFGAARRAIGDHTQAFTAILKPSYAPIEQYAESVSLRQGPWTDVYAIGAVIHFLLKGVPPPPATARTFEDHSEVLAQTSIPGVSATFLAAVDWALAVRPQDRPQSVSEFRDALDGKLVPPVVVRKAVMAPLSFDAFVRTAPDPTRPAVHEIQTPPVTENQTTVLLQPATAKRSNLTDPKPVGPAQMSTDPTAPFKVSRPEISVRSGGFTAGAAAAPPVMPPLLAPSTDPRIPAAPSHVASPASLAQAPSASRAWVWGLPALLLLAAAAAWWWAFQHRTVPDASGAAAAPSVATDATKSLPMAPPPSVVAVPVQPAAVEAKGVVMESVPVATEAAAVATPPSMTAAKTVTTEVPKSPAAQPVDRNEVSTKANPSTSTASNTTSATTGNAGGPATRIVLEPRPQRSSTNQSEAQRGGSTDSRAVSANAQRPQAASSPMWPPAPAPNNDEQRARAPATATAARPAEKTPESPADVCAPRSFLFRTACMQNECRSARFSAHPQCVQVRAQEEIDQQRRIFGGNR